MFEESFGLEQIYVPLRAWYQERPGKSSRGGPVRDESAEEKPHRVVVDLEDHLDDWLGDPKDPIRVICGGPGSGKTSAAKMWGARLAVQGHRVLYVPLHRLDFQGRDAQKALADFVRDWNVLPFDPLDAREGEKRLLVLFDGLDELAMQGRAGQEVARDFVEAIGRRVDNINQMGDRLVQVIFGGRDVVVAASERLLAERQILHVLPYHGSDGEEFAEGRELLDDSSYGCDRWWKQFGEVVGENYDDRPEPLRRDELAEVTAQPLLNYLLALSFRREKLDFTTAPNLNAIYADLLDAVYERPWGPAGHPATKPLTPEEFDALLNELGLAAWHGAGRTVTELEVERACERAGLSEQLARFQEGARAGAIGLLAAFYFRQAGKIEGGERTFEFTHKSFGEYLIARRLVRWIGTIDKMRRFRGSERDLGWGEEDSLVKWIEVTGPATLDRDLLAFVQREVALKAYDSRDVVDGWRETVAELFSDQLRHGLPIHRLALPTFREMTRQARNAEEALLAALWACAEAIEDHSAVDWPHSTSFGAMIKRLQGQRSGPENVTALACLGRLGLLMQSCPVADLFKANLERANLEKARLEAAALVSANLRGANLRGAVLEWARLNLANLARADLEGAMLEEADLENANLEGANLRRADLQEANLRNANLKGAELRRVQYLDKALGLDTVESWQGAKIERKWVELLKERGLDLEERGIDVVDDVDED